MSSESNGSSVVMIGGWRKWSIAMVALAMGFTLGILGKLTTDFATIASITIGAFSAGNAVEHWKKDANR